MNHKPNHLKIIEKELALHKEKLRISQSLVKVGFWELNLKSETIHLSAEASSILRIKENRETLTIEEFASICADNERVILINEFTKFINGISDLNIEFTLKEKTQYEDVIINAIANYSSESNYLPNTLIGIVQDVTEQKNTEKLLKRAKDRAEEADTLKSAFLANMSHEIRTPLNAILGFSRLLTNPALEDSQRKEYSEYITSSANNLLNLIRDIIDVSKIEAGKISVEKSKCLVNKILKELKYTFEREKVGQGKESIEIQLHSEVKDDNFAVLTDPFRFHQILVNLIGNALKFIENGFIEFGYVVSSKSVLQFYVKDTGIGIPEDKLDLIFSRFGQIINDKIKNPGGTGLGLSITKHLVERLGGKIWVESEINVGTTFYFTLPFEQLEGSGYEHIRFNSTFKSLEIRELNILAVEDDPINMILLEDTLKLHIPNIKISKAFNGLEAIEILKNAHFDLIIMDIRMPHLNGYETTEKIRQEFTSPRNNTPILGLSAHALKTEIEKGKKLGMNDFLSKPIQADELLSKIKKLCMFANFDTKTDETNEIISSSTLNFIDLSFFNKLFKNNDEKIKSTLKEYIKQVPEQINSLKELNKNNETEKLKTIAHSLKSTFKYIGRTDLSDISREIEVNANGKDAKTIIQSSIKKIETGWNEIQNEIMEKIIK